MSGTITIQPTSVEVYRNGRIETGDSTVRLGYLSSGYTGFHDVAIELDLPKAVKSLTVYQDWRSRSPSNVYPTYAVWVTKEALMAPPEDGAVDAAEATFHFASSNDATVTIEKRLAKGKWYLWFGRPRNNGEAAAFLSGDRGTHPILEITGETAGAGHAYKNGAWQDAEPKIYKNGEWREAAGAKYKDGWGELQ